jgi:hypothetical protein
MYPILPISFSSFDRKKKIGGGKERLKRVPEGKMRKKDPNHIKVM